jgi:hypothetical protein
MIVKNNVRHVIRSGVLYESREPNINAICIRYDSSAEAYQIWGVKQDPKTKLLNYFQMDPKINYLILSHIRAMVRDLIRHELDEKTGLLMPVRWVSSK